MIDSAGERFARLVQVMRVLRSPEGCPWDRKQTLETLRPFLLEETYEVLDAIERGDRAALRQEIGDLLFEAVFLAQICAESGSFDIADSLQSIVDKLVRRHPHVFGDDPGHEAATERPATADEVVEQWEVLKARERVEAGDRPRALAGVPRTLPALLRAFEIGSRAAALGFDWERAGDVIVKIEEEVAELRQLAADGMLAARAEEEMGDLLFAIANLSRKLGIEPEAALRRAITKFVRRFETLEDRFHARGRTLQEATLEEMEAEWQRVKNHEAHQEITTKDTKTFEPRTHEEHEGHEDI